MCDSRFTPSEAALNFAEVHSIFRGFAGWRQKKYRHQTHGVILKVRAYSSGAVKWLKTPLSVHRSDKIIIRNWIKTYWLLSGRRHLQQCSVLFCFFNKRAASLPHTYLMCFVQVLECSWDELWNKVQQAQDLDHIIAAHEVFLDTIISRCLLDNNSRVIHTRTQTQNNFMRLFWDFHTLSGTLSLNCFWIGEGLQITAVVIKARGSCFEKHRRRSCYEL